MWFGVAVPMPGKEGSGRSKGVPHKIRANVSKEVTDVLFYNEAQERKPPNMPREDDSGIYEGYSENPLSFSQV